MDIKISKLESGGVLLVLNGDLDSLSVEEFKGEIQTLIDQNFVNIVINMSQIYKVDSEGAGALAAIYKVAENKGGKIEIVAPSKSVAHILATTGLDQVFLVRKS